MRAYRLSRLRSELIMNKALMDGLVAKFVEDDRAPVKDAICQKQSTEFRRFWSDQVLAKGTGTISDDECNKVIRILDENGPGNKGSEVVAKTGISNGKWRKLFNDLHSDQKLASLVDSIFKETNLDRKTALFNELYETNKQKSRQKRSPKVNQLTGKNAVAINALLAAYDPVKNLSAVSLEHRKLLLDFLQLKLPFDWDQATFGQKIVQSNVLLLEGTRALGLDGTARTLCRFLYSEPVGKLWKPEHKSKRTDKEKVSVTVSQNVETEKDDNPNQKLTRICYNSRDWQRPSGDAKELEGPKSYVHQHGFGHEEWLFRSEWNIGGWRYAFLQGVNDSRRSLLAENRPFDLTLFTIEAIIAEEDYIDVSVRTGTELLLFEIKSDLEPRVVIRQALGQILEYAFHPLRAKTLPVRLIIVGRCKLSCNEQIYIDLLCQKFSLPLEYRVVPI